MPRVIIANLPVSHSFTTRFPQQETVVEGNTGWITLYPLGRVSSSIYLHLHVVANNGVRNAVILCAPTPALTSSLDEAALDAANVWTIPGLRVDNTGIATAFKARWRRGRYNASGSLVDGVAVPTTMFGFEYDVLSELDEEEDLGVGGNGNSPLIRGLSQKP